MWTWTWLACEPTTRPDGPDDRTPAPGLQVGPADAVWGRDALWCEAPDGAPTRWSVDGAPITTVGGGVPAPMVRAGRRWTCSAPGFVDAELEPRIAGGNVLVFLLDDVGRDRLRSFGGTESLAVTPMIDALRDQGVVFERAWTMPLCSPARAALVTGRLPHRTGVGTLIDKGVDLGLSPDEVSFADALALADPPYDSLWAGKWHLSSVAAGPDHAHQLGFARVYGSMANLDARFQPAEPPDPELPLGYFQFEWNQDGALVFESGYATEHLVEDFERELAGLAEPWVSVVAFNAAHEPWHVPPPEWRRSDISAPFTDSHRVDYMVESVDLAIERILRQVPGDTTVVLMADNGTAAELVLAPYEGGLLASKGTLTEGGINVPMIVAGPLVRTPGVSTALVEVTDLYDTLLAIAGLNEADVDAVYGATPRDSVSLLPYLSDPQLPSLRSTVYAERFDPNVPGGERWLYLRAARDARFKLVRYEGEGVPTFEALFDLGDAMVEGAAVDPDGSPEAREAYDRLWGVLQEHASP
ncbi:MAG: sulfatase-like hydrolase/transferase [Myxococcota bacterium]